MNFLTEAVGGKLFKITVLVLAVFFALTCLLLCPDGFIENEEYPLKNSFLQQEQYKLQFAAFLDGHIALDAVPSEILSQIENPYDPDSREAADLHPYYREFENSYLWDAAYYDGQYFSYFGIAPILTVYYPYYILTGNIPSHVAACLILSVLACFFLMLAYRETLLAFCPRANYVLGFFGAIALFFCSGIPIGIVCADNYYLAVISALCFSMAAIFSGLYAVRKTKKHAKCVLFVLCAIFLTLTVWSRPSSALMCLILVPTFVSYLKNVIESKKLIEFLPTALFLLTLSCGAAFVMLYNYARFDSVFEFGAKYQLTVNDISKNTLSFHLLAESIYSYFLQTPGVNESVKIFIEPTVRFFTSTDRFIYSTENIGSLWFGLPTGVVVGFNNNAFSRNKTAFFTRISVIVLALFIGFVNFCIGGVSMRYMLDILPITALVGIGSMTEAVCFSTGKRKMVLTVAFAILCVAATACGIGCTVFFSKALL